MQLRQQTGADVGGAATGHQKRQKPLQLQKQPQEHTGADVGGVTGRDEFMALMDDPIFGLFRIRNLDPKKSMKRGATN